SYLLLGAPVLVHGFAPLQRALLASLLQLNQTLLGALKRSLCLRPGQCRATHGHVRVDLRPDRFGGPANGLSLSLGGSRGRLDGIVFFLLGLSSLLVSASQAVELVLGPLGSGALFVKGARCPLNRLPGGRGNGADLLVLGNVDVKFPADY